VISTGFHILLASPFVDCWCTNLGIRTLPGYISPNFDFYYNASTTRALCNRASCDFTLDGAILPELICPEATPLPSLCLFPAPVPPSSPRNYKAAPDPCSAELPRAGMLPFFGILTLRLSRAGPRRGPPRSLHVGMSAYACRLPLCGCP